MEIIILVRSRDPSCTNDTNKLYLLFSLGNHRGAIALFLCLDQGYSPILSTEINKRTGQETHKMVLHQYWLCDHLTYFVEPKVSASHPS